MLEKLSISLVTPAYNSVGTIERTIQSILNQKYPNLEYIIIDGNSNDGTVDIIRQYESHLSYWVSEPDKGMYDALIKGFNQSTGEIMGWLNSDDKHAAWTLKVVNRIFQEFPEIEWITSVNPAIWNADGHIVEVMQLPGFNKDAFLRGENSSASIFSIEQIQQESTFWRRSLWDRAGARMDTSLKLAGDFELWARFFQHADLIGVRNVIAGIYLHPNQMTNRFLEQRIEEEKQVIVQYGGKLHATWSAYVRKHLAPLIPNRLAAQMGIKYPAKIVMYNDAAHKWELQTIYF